MQSTTIRVVSPPAWITHPLTIKHLITALKSAKIGNTALLAIRNSKNTPIWKPTDKLWATPRRKPDAPTPTSLEYFIMNGIFPEELTLEVQYSSNNTSTGNAAVSAATALHEYIKKYNFMGCATITIPAAPTTMPLGAPPSKIVPGQYVKQTLQLPTGTLRAATAHDAECAVLKDNIAKTTSDPKKLAALRSEYASRKC